MNIPNHVFALLCVALFLSAVYLWVQRAMARKALVDTLSSAQATEASLRHKSEALSEKLAKAEQLAASRDDRLEVLEREVDQLEARRNVAWPKPEGRLEDAAVLEEFNVDVTEPWFVAVMQELDDSLADLLDEVTLAPGPTLNAEQRTHLAGGAEALRVLQKRLLDLRKRATVAGAEELGEDGEKAGDET